MARLRWVLLGVAGAIALAGTGFVAAGALPFGGEEHEQPIAFPHNVHAGTNQIPCMYCHYSADQSPDAGIPPVSVCAGCHLPGSQPGDPNAQALVAADSLGVQQLTEYWRNDERIEWVRIHDLPDHVHFPHNMHVNAGVDCAECHGQVEEMDQVYQVASLEMGWCIDCHQDPPENVQAAGIEAVRIDCFVCHY